MQYTEGLQLFKTTFDNSENKIENAVKTELIATFIQDEYLTIQKKLSGYVANLAPVDVYAGWDGQIYPKYHTETIKLI
jgi:hypothetical protein